MSDHLDFLRIRGLEHSDTEVFQGVSGGVSDAASSETDSAAAVFDWGNLPDAVSEQVQGYFEAVSDWWASATADRGLRGSRGLPALRPAVPLVVATAVGAASGGTLTLPALAVTFLVQIGMGLIDGIMGEVAKLVVPDQLEEILGKALLDGDQSILKQALLNNGEAILKQALLTDDESILKLALLFTEDETLKSVLNERLKDLLGVDLQIDTNDLKVSTKTGVIEYA